MSISGWGDWCQCQRGLSDLIQRNGGTTVKKYKLVLQNGTKQVRVQVNEDGEIS
jgi:hypothetical protein